MPGVRQPDDARIRDELKAEPDRHFDAGLAGIHASRRAVRRRLEVCVPKAAISARGNQRALPWLDEIGEKGLVVLGKDLGSWRDLQHGIVAGRASHVGAHPVLAVAGLEMLLIPEIDQRVEVRNALDPHVPAPASVAAVRSSEFDKFFTPEGKAAIPAVPRADVNFCLI